jgi:gliding motility-associated lipoprotein GldD
MDDPVSSIFAFILLQWNPMLWMSIPGIAFFLALSALVAAAEVSFFSLSPSDLDELSQTDSYASRKILELLGKQKKLIATVVLLHNLVNIFVIILSESVSKEIFHGLSPDLEFLLRVILVTFLILLIGEIIPKIYTRRHAKRAALILVFPLDIAERFFRPFSYLLIRSTSLFDRYFKDSKTRLSVDDLSTALELTSNEHSPEEEQKILKGIVEFGNTEAREIMRPRLQMFSISKDLPFGKALSSIVEAGFSRIPVYEQNDDHIVGILYTKDLLPHLDKEDDFAWNSLMQKPYYVPMNKKIDDLLKEFQHQKMHMAIVVDEYGATNGLVTLEDIIEEILGDINDEFDDDELVYSKLDSHTYIFEARIMLNDFYKVLQIDGEVFEKNRGEADTLAGFILEITGSIPLKNQKITFKNYSFVVESVDRKRIKRVKLMIEEESKSKTIMPIVLLLGASLLISSCQPEFPPKPRGYMRIDFPDKKYISLSANYPYGFDYPVYARPEVYKGIQDGQYWMNLQFDQNKATLFISYFALRNDLAKHIEDARTLAYKHTVKASSIDEMKIEKTEERVFGLLYELGGDAASSTQFYLTDSVHHFVRGALYFNVPVNTDSLAPANQFIRKDIERLILSFHWKKT